MSDAAPRPWRLFKAGERSELPHIADANGRVVARAEGNLWVWQDFIAPMIVAAVNAHETPDQHPCVGKIVGEVEDSEFVLVEWDNDEHFPKPGTLLFVRLWTQAELDEANRHADERLASLKVGSGSQKANGEQS